MRIPPPPLFVAAFVAAAAAPGLVAADDLKGRWVTSKNNVAIEMFACGEAICGRIDWLSKPYDPDGALKRDEANPDPALRARPWCGITVVTGLRQTADGVWEGGEAYSPKDGRRYALEVVARDEGAMEVRGFVGHRLLGKTETWTRDLSDAAACPES